MAEAHEIAERLVATFQTIGDKRMFGVPILNPRLEVEVISTRRWGDYWLSVLVTPWFINLMLFPATPEKAAHWATLPLGSDLPYRLPAGRFDFIVAEEPDLGRYQMCSLFSPVLEFESQEAARVAAAAALEAVFDATLDPAHAPEAKSAGDAPAAADAPGRPERPGEEPVLASRRGLLTGRIAPREGGV